MATGRLSSVFSYPKLVMLVIVGGMSGLLYSGISPYSVGVLFPKTEISNHFLFHFFHASFFHFAINVYCLLSFAFVGNVSIGEMCCAFLCASFAPFCVPFAVCEYPTIGASAFCFALAALNIPIGGLRQLSFIALSIAIASFMPNINSSIHCAAFCLARICLYGRKFERHIDRG